MAGRRKRRETNPFYVIFNDWNNVGTNDEKWVFNSDGSIQNVATGQYLRSVTLNHLVIKSALYDNYNLYHFIFFEPSRYQKRNLKATEIVLL